MTRRALFAAIASVVGLFLRPGKRDPELIDEENPEVTEEELRRARPAAEVLPELIGPQATDELTRQSRDRREWDELRAYGQARFRAMLHADGLDPDRMSEDEMMDYIDRIIHERREEEGERERRQEQPDDDNPEITEKELCAARPAAEVLPELIGPEATTELMRSSQERLQRLFT